MMATTLQKHHLTPNIIYIIIVFMVLLFNAARCVSKDVSGILSDKFDMVKLQKSLESDDSKLMTDDYLSVWDSYFSQPEKVDLKHDSMSLLERWIFMTEEKDNISQPSGSSLQLENGFKGFSNNTFLNSAITLYQTFNRGHNISDISKIHAEMISKSKEGLVSGNR